MAAKLDLHLLNGDHKQKLAVFRDLQDEAKKDRNLLSNIITGRKTKIQ